VFRGHEMRGDDTNPVCGRFLMWKSEVTVRSDGALPMLTRETTQGGEVDWIGWAILDSMMIGIR